MHLDLSRCWNTIGNAPFCLLYNVIIQMKCPARASTGNAPHSHYCTCVLGPYMQTVLCSHCFNCLIVFHRSHCVKYDALHWSLNLSIRSLTVQNQIPLPCNWILRMGFLLFDSLFGRVQVPFFIFIFIFLETPFTFPLSVSKKLIWSKCKTIFKFETS